MDCEEESSSDERDAMEAVVNSLVEENDENGVFDECIQEGIEECSLMKHFPCSLCSKICKSKGGLTKHTRAKHGEKLAVPKSVSPLTAKVVEEIVSKAVQSVVKSKLYGEPVATILAEADPKPSQYLVEKLTTLYEHYSKKRDRDKLLENFYKLMVGNNKMFNTAESKKLDAPACNLIMIQIPDLMIGFYKRGNVKEKLPDIKPIEKSEFGPLSYVTGYVISKMFRKSKVSQKECPEKCELQTLLLSMRSMHDNEYIDSLSRGKLWNPCDNLMVITAECEKVFRQHSAGLVREIPLEHVRADVMLKPKVKSAWDAILSDASMDTNKTSVAKICLENIIMLYIRVRSFSYTKDIVTQMTIKEKVKFHKKALRKTLKKQSEAAAEHE